jgi:FG-GAP repeat
MRHPVLSKAGRSSPLVTRAPRPAAVALAAAVLLAASFAATIAAPPAAAAAAFAPRPPASELTPLEAAAPYGSVLAISGDTAAVTGLVAGQAVVFVFVRGASGWAEQARILDPVAGAGSASAFGNALALSGDTLAVGAGAPSAPVGYVNVYVRAGGAWSFQAHLQPPRASGLGFGAALALAGDSLVAGVPGSAAGHDTGAAYVYARQGAAWRREAILTAEDPVPDDGFGRAVGVAHQHVVVGGHGFAEVFDRTGGTWRRAAVLASTGAGFGSSVAASLETVAVGDPEAQRVTLFIHGGGQWSHQADLTPPDAAAGEFGSAISLSQDALAVGAPGTSRPHAAASGAAYVFVRLVHRWRLGGTFGLAAPAPGERFGGAVAVSLHSALVGSKGDAEVPTSAWVLEGLDNP